MVDPAQKSRIATLDSLRGLAILLVLLAHYLAPRLDYSGPGYLVSTFGGGGVLLFFILSGYLITKTRQNLDAGTFLARRLWKLFPAYLGACFLAIFLIYLTGKSLPSLRELACNFTMTQDVFGQPMFSTVFWTLLIEIKFYFLMALFGTLIPMIPSSVVVLFFFSCNALLYFTYGRGSNLLGFFPVFFIGVAMYRLESKGWKIKESWDLIAVTFLTSTGILLFQIENHISNAIFCILWAAIGILVMKLKWQSVLLNKLGKISYSLYLYHTILGYFLFNWIRLYFHVNSWVALVLAIPIVLLASNLSFCIVESPCVSLGRHMEGSWKARKNKQCIIS